MYKYTASFALFVLVSCGSSEHNILYGGVDPKRIEVGDKSYLIYDRSSDTRLLITIPQGRAFGSGLLLGATLEDQNDFQNVLKIYFENEKQGCSINSIQSVAFQVHEALYSCIQ